MAKLKIDKLTELFYIETMPTNTKLISKEFVCIDKRIGYLALLIIFAAVLIVISSMVNSQKMTQNSKASEYFKPTKTPIPKPTLKTYYIKPIMDVCFDSLDEIGKMPLYTGIKDVYELALETCYEDLNSFIISNDGEWPGPLLSRGTGTSRGFLAADKIAITWLDNEYLHSLYNYTPGTLQQEARKVIMKNLAKQRDILSPLKFSR